MILLIAGSLLVGAVVGVIAGLLGVGGGLIIVPLLVLLLHWVGVPAALVTQVAVATSLATIIVTNSASTWQHHRHQAVLWSLVGRYGPGVVVGSWLGALLAVGMPGAWLRGLFGCFELLVAAQMYFSLGAREGAGRPLPAWGMALAGVAIGLISALFGIGGGTLSVPVLTFFAAVPIRQAVATSSAIGVLIALSGSVGFIGAGAGMGPLAGYSLGYVALIPFTAIISMTLLTTRLGVHLAHTLEPARLKRIFALFLALVGTAMVAGAAS